MWQMIAGPGLRCAATAFGRQAMGLLNLSLFIEDVVKLFDGSALPEPGRGSWELTG